MKEFVSKKTGKTLTFRPKDLPDWLKPLDAHARETYAANKAAVAAIAAAFTERFGVPVKAYYAPYGNLNIYVDTASQEVEAAEAKAQTIDLGDWLADRATEGRAA